MHLSDWLIICTSIGLMLVSMIAGLRSGSSYLGVWAAVMCLAPGSLMLNHHWPPYGAVLFFGLPTIPFVPVAMYALWLRSSRAV